MESRKLFEQESTNQQENRTDLPNWPMSVWDTMRMLLDLGYSPIPNKPRSKVPAVYWEQLGYKSGDVPITHDLIDQWEKTLPADCNVAILLGPKFGVMALDTDSLKGRQYLLDQYDGELNTWTERSSRGHHHFFTCPPDIKGMWAGENSIRPEFDLDVLADGQIHVSPSIHPDGTPYVEIVPMSTPLLPAPDWLLKDIRRRMKADSQQVKPTPTTEPTIVSNLPLSSPVVEAIEKALGVEYFKANGWSNALWCPFHNDGKNPDSGWKRTEKGGYLKCFACGRNYSLVEVASRLKIRWDYSTDSETIEEVVIKNNNKQLDAELVAFFPTLLNQGISVVNFATNSKRGPKAAYVTLTMGVEQMIDHLKLEDVSFRALTKDQMSSSKKYAAATYSTFESGAYYRKELADRLGVSSSTARRYDKESGVDVHSRYKRKTLTSEDGKSLGNKHNWNRWLESTSGKKFGAFYLETWTDDDGIVHRHGFLAALHDSLDYDGRAIVYLVERKPNRYVVPEYDDAPIGLPIEIRLALIRQGQTNLARVLDALLMAGVQPKQHISTKRVINICAQFGISKDTVYRVFRNLKE